MNDRFKFRVWDNIHKRYIYCDFAGYCSVDYLGKGEKRIVFMPSGVEQIKNGKPLLYAKEDEAKIEQCTGLKDKNGKLIYEGDIVKLSSDREVVCSVVWDNEETGFCVEYKKELYRFNTYRKYHLIEVIGNIHENKDLVK